MVKAHKISFYVFLTLIIATLVVFGLFFGVGYDNVEGKYVAPEHTETLLLFMYFMTAVCILVAVIGAIMTVVSSFGGPKGVSTTGVPDKAISIVSVSILVVTMIVSWAMASDAVLTLPNGNEFADATLLKITDMFIYAIYALLAIATVGLIVNLSGVFKK